MVASPGELSFMTMNILMEGISNRHAVVVSPAYQSLYQVLKSLGCELSYWTAEEGKDGWKFDIEKLRALVRPDTRLIVINFPHNPTGAYLTREELEEVVAIARECGAYIYSDEMYRDLLIRCPLGNGDMTAAESGGSAGKVYEPLPPVCDIYERGISLWGWPNPSAWQVPASVGSHRRTNGSQSNCSPSNHTFRCAAAHLLRYSLPLS